MTDITSSYVPCFLLVVCIVFFGRVKHTPSYPMVRAYKFFSIFFSRVKTRSVGRHYLLDSTPHPEHPVLETSRSYNVWQLCVSSSSARINHQLPLNRPLHNGPNGRLNLLHLFTSSPQSSFLLHGADGRANHGDNVSSDH
jgi:hypothetical protein